MLIKKVIAIFFLFSLFLGIPLIAYVTGKQEVTTPKIVPPESQEKPVDDDFYSLLSFRKCEEKDPTFTYAEKGGGADFSIYALCFNDSFVEYYAATVSFGDLHNYKYVLMEDLGGGFKQRFLTDMGSYQKTTEIDYSRYGTCRTTMHINIGDNTLDRIHGCAMMENDKSTWESNTTLDWAKVEKYISTVLPLFEKCDKTATEIGDVCDR